MSEVKRYDIAEYGGGMDVIVDGTYVGAVDFDRVTAERDALQARLTAADERADVLAHLLREGLEEYKDGDDWIERVIAALKPSEGGGDESAHDRAYRNGLMQGYNLALNGSEKEYQDAVARYSGGKDAE